MKTETLVELKRVKYKDLEGMVYRMEVTNDEIVDILDIKHKGASTNGCTLAPAIFQSRDLNSMLIFFADKVRVKITIDDLRLRSNSTTNKTMNFRKNIFFLYTVLRFTQSHSARLSDSQGLIQKIPEIYRSGKKLNIPGFDKVHFKSDSINASVVYSIREPTLYSFVLNKPPGHTICKEPTVELP